MEHLGVIGHERDQMRMAEGSPHILICFVAAEPEEHT